MSTEDHGDQPSEDRRRSYRLGYLLKHAQQKLFDLTDLSLAPFGLIGREVAVLLAVDEGNPLSQGEIARRMGIDRTTMVALIDELQQKGLVHRRQDPDDRRRNVVELTEIGRDTLRQANRAAQEAERLFLAPLPAEDIDRFKEALRSILFGAQAD